MPSAAQKCRGGAWGSPTSCLEHEGLPIESDGWCIEGRPRGVRAPFIDGVLAKLDALDAEPVDSRHVQLVEPPRAAPVIACQRGASPRRAVLGAAASDGRQLGLFAEPSCSRCGCSASRPCTAGCSLAGSGLCAACTHGRAAA